MDASMEAGLLEGSFAGLGEPDYRDILCENREKWKMTLHCLVWAVKRYHLLKWGVPGVVHT